MTNVAAARAGSTEVRGPGFVPKVEPRLTLPTAAFARWERGNVRPQKQAGYAVATATVPLGDLTSAQLRVLADLAASFSDGTLRMTHELSASPSSCACALLTERAS